MKGGTLLARFCVTVFLVAPVLHANAQDSENLVKELTNPISTLIREPFQFSENQTAQ
jgi:hypothetical protein